MISDLTGHLFIYNIFKINQKIFIFSMKENKFHITRISTHIYTLDYRYIIYSKEKEPGKRNTFPLSNRKPILFLLL